MIEDDQNAQPMGDNCSDMKPEQGIEETESSHSDTCTDLIAQMTVADQNTQMTETDMSPDQKAQMTEVGQNTRMTEMDMSLDQKAQMTEAEQNTQMTETDMSLDEKAQSTEADQNTQMTETDTCPEQKDQVAEADQITQMTETDMSPDQKAQSTEDSSSDTIPDLKGKLIYRCKKCRQIVAAEESLVPHEQGKGEASFKRKKGVEQTAPECTAIFVEPLKWMVPVEEGYLWEKLYCRGCKSKIGSFSWIGMQCSCGAWVRPAFQILKNRIDECRI